MNKKELIIHISCIGIFFVLAIIWTILVSNGVFDKMDHKVLNSILSWRGEKGNFIYWLVRIITEGAFFYFLVPFVLLIMVLSRFDLKSMTFGIGACGQFLVNSITKLIVSRPRPDSIYRWVHETSPSFPSGHSTTATFVYGFLIYLIFNTRMNKKLKIALSISSGLMIPTIFFTRLVLSVHYLSDVLGGFLFGGLMVSIAIFIHRWFYLKGYNGFKRMIDRKIGNLE